MHCKQRKIFILFLTHHKILTKSLYFPSFLFLFFCFHFPLHLHLFLLLLPLLCNCNNLKVSNTPSSQRKQKVYPHITWSPRGFVRCFLRHICISAAHAAPHNTPYHTTPHYSTLFHSLPRHQMLRHATPVHTTSRQRIPLHESSIQVTPSSPVVPPPHLLLAISSLREIMCVLHHCQPPFQSLVTAKSHGFTHSLELIIVSSRSSAAGEEICSFTFSFFVSLEIPRGRTFFFYFGLECIMYLCSSDCISFVSLRV